MSIALPYALRVVRRKADSVPERGDQILYLALEILYISPFAIYFRSFVNF